MYSYFMNDSESLIQSINNQSKAQKLRCSDLGVISEITFPGLLYEPKLRVDPAVTILDANHTAQVVIIYWIWKLHK